MSVAGRVVCGQCGANNFDTQAACWKCGASLSAPPAASPSASMTPARSQNGGGYPPSPMTAPVAPAAFRPALLDPAVAFWSAVALGVLFPFFAVPVGIVFLMLDDRRKAEVGRITLVWGIIGSVFHTLVTAWMIRGAVNQVRSLIPFPGRGTSIRLPQNNAQPPSLTGPAPQDAVRDLNFPAP